MIYLVWEHQAVHLGIVAADKTRKVAVAVEAQPEDVVRRKADVGDDGSRHAFADDGEVLRAVGRAETSFWTKKLVDVGLFIWIPKLSVQSPLVFEVP